MRPTPMIEVLEEDRHWWFATRTRAILAYLDRTVGTNRRGRILDVGCGAANMTHHLRQYGQVVGVDNNPRPLEVARQRGLECYQSSADNLPFGPAEFNLVALLDTLEHIPDDERVLAECGRVLQVGGKLLITAPAFKFLWSHNDVINMHQRRYTIRQLTERLERQGFRILQATYTNFFVFPLAAGLIVLRRGRAEPELASPHFDDDAYQVEMEPAPPLLNALLSLVGRVEVALLRRVSLPVGTSVMVIAEKTAQAN